MNNFSLKKSNQLKYTEWTFKSKESTETVGGRYYYYAYKLDAGAEAPGRMAILKNYEEAAEQLNGKLFSSLDGNGNANRVFKIMHKGKEIWLQVSLVPYSEKEYSLSIIEKGKMLQEVTVNADYEPADIPEPKYEKVPDKEGTKDHPLFSNRMKGFFIWSSSVADFDKYTFGISREEKYEVEGKITVVSYRLMPGATFPGGLGILRNYQNAIEQIGGKLMALHTSSNTPKGIYKVVQGANAIWVEVTVNTVVNRYSVLVLETKALEQQVKANAEYLAENIKNSGRVAVYGILFDTGKSIIKPESKEPIAEIAKLLEVDPALNLFIVGHTDMDGDYKENLELAKDRAKAVVKWLVDKHQVKADRLTPQGVGPLAPVASNEDEAGKRLNRRVELVKR